MSNDKRKVGVRLLTLSGCNHCNLLKNGLDAEGITYTNIDADVYSAFADQVEFKFQTKLYPIVFLEVEENVITLLSETNLELSDEIRTFNSIPELIGIIKSYI
jgi:glutaredoxin